MYKVISLFTLLLLFSCDDYDSFTTDRSAMLHFDRDTVAFDTLLATVPSATQTLSVHNVGDKGLRISEVRLEQGAASPFRVNVDGQDLTLTGNRRATGFEVRRRDSLIVRVEVTLPESGQDEPQPVQDALLFTLESGVRQRVPLTAMAQDACFLSLTAVTADTVFADRRPVVVRDSLIVAEGATLTLAAGSRLFFHDGAGLTVRGRLVVEGTTEQPVVMRTDRTDRIFPYLPYDRLPARWQGLRFAATSFDNVLTGLDLHGATFGIQCEPTDAADERLKLTLADCRIHNLGGDGLTLTDCRAVVSNTEVSNTLGHCVYLCGGDAVFTHCTLAQFYALDASRGMALVITTQDSLYHPLHRADFINSVVTGYAEDVIVIPSLDRSLLPSDHSALPINYLFDHCFLATEVPESTPEADYAARFLNCTFEDAKAETAREKNFTLFDTHAFLYDFTPVESSLIRGVADPVRAAAFPLDRLGRQRLADEHPDAGAYEFTSP